MKNKLICFIMGHDWGYNPDFCKLKKMCFRCNKKVFNKSINPAQP